MPLEESTLETVGGERRSWLHRGPDRPHRLAVMLDGEFYLEHVGAWPVIEQLTAEGRIPAMSWLFVESGGAAARHVDYVPNPRFARFVAHDLLTLMGQRLDLVDGGHLIGGLSLSGLAAARIAVAYSDVFSAALCQSASLWIEPDAFDTHVAGHPPPGRFWLSVGDAETVVGVTHPPSGIYQGLSQIDGVERARAALAPVARAVHTHTYAGGHEFAPWRLELPDALRWLLAPGAAS